MDEFDYGLFIDGQLDAWDGFPAYSGGDGYCGYIDCSHLVWRLYGEQGFEYPYMSTSQMLNKDWNEGDYLTEITEPVQGCIVVYSSGHAGIWMSEQNVFSAQTGLAKEVKVGEHSYFPGSRRYFVWNKWRNPEYEY